MAVARTAAIVPGQREVREDTNSVEVETLSVSELEVSEEEVESGE